MNAVTLNAPNQFSPAALSPALLSKGPTAGGGFTDLISLLLATVRTDSEPSVATSASSSDPVPSNDVVFSNRDVSPDLLVSRQLVPYKGQSATTLPNVLSSGVTSATPYQIASALIRFMAKGGGPGTPASSPPTGAAKKASSDQRSANASKTTALPLVPANPAAAIALVAPHPPAVTVDPEVVAQTISIPNAAERKTEIVSGAVTIGSVTSGPAINEQVTNGAERLASPMPTLPDPSSLNLKLTGPPPAATAPVAFKMQLTPLNPQEIPDPEETSDPHSTPIPQSSTASEIPPETGPATETPAPPPSTPDPVSSPVFTAVSAVISSTAFTPTAFRGPALNAGKNPDEPDQGTPSVVTKTISEVTAADQTKQGSGQKSNTDAKSDAEPNTGQNSPEKNPVAADSSTPAGNQAVFPALHTPAPPQPAPSHAGSAVPKDVDQPTALPKSDAKDVLAAPPSLSGQTQQIDVRISQPQAPPVDLQVAQRSGQIQVVVRTSDAGLETALRQDLGTLVHSLERSGFQAETFIPNGLESSQTNSHADSQDKHSDSSANGSFGQGAGQNQGRNGGRGSGGNSRGNASRDPQFEAWTNRQDQQQDQQERQP